MLNECTTLILGRRETRLMIWHSRGERWCLHEEVDGEPGRCAPGCRLKIAEESVDPGGMRLL